MTKPNQHPITPPPELMQQWWTEETYDPFGAAISRLAAQAAQWGSDQELEACCEVLARELICDGKHVATDLRMIRRPKPPSLKEQALQILDTHGNLTRAEADTIRRALEALDD